MTSGHSIPNIYLVGFMGAGKSTVGAGLAAALERPFVDLDQRIEAVAGMSIVEIFAGRGEPFFRQLEWEALRSTAAGSGQVVALGGGTFCRPEAVALARETGFSIWLDCPCEGLLRRCREMHAPRPLARDEREFQALYELRLSFYQQAHARVDTSGRSVTAVIREIQEILHWIAIQPQS